jgi:hypothetical protein
MEEEMECMDSFGAWELVPRPAHATTLKHKWVFRIKTDAQGFVEKLKSRLTICGYAQKQGRDYDQTWASTGRLRTFRWMMAEKATTPGMQSVQLDLTSAFLHAFMDRECYMEQPEGFAKPGFEDYVCLLRKALYGTKQAPRLFLELLQKKILDFAATGPGISVVQSVADDCLYTIRRGDELLRVLTFVDDMASTLTSSKLYREFFAHLSSTMRITDYNEAPISKFCGIAVTEHKDGSVGLSQSSYIHEVLARLGLSDCADALSPEATGAKAKLRPLEAPLSPNEAEFMSEVPYREAVGALWYVARGTRMDVFRAVQEVAAHADKPGPAHWRALLRIFRYLKRTAAAELVMRSQPARGDRVPDGLDARLVGNSDSDWAGDPTTSRSRTGWIVRFMGSLVAWRAEVQSSTSQSSCEAEYVALCALANEIAWWRLLLSEVGHAPTGPTPLLCDNEAATNLADHACKFESTKHIMLKYHVLRQYQSDKQIRAVWTPGERQWADVLTKNVSVKLFRKVVTFLLGSSV